MQHVAISDSTVVLRHGDPRYSDQFGARDVWVFRDGERYLMHYDAAGPLGWRSALAISTDGEHWTKRGPILDLGGPADDDSASASYGTTYFDGARWHMFYLGTPNATPDQLKTPSFPYLTMKATAEHALGPWEKQPNVRPLSVASDTWYSHTASPGQVIPVDGGWLMLFSAATISDTGQILRTLGTARTRALDASWTVDPEPLLPLTEQIENSSLYFEPANGLWFLFTNHVGVARDAAPEPPQQSAEYTDAVWMYWARDPTGFSPTDKAIVVDAATSGWSPRIIGLPSVLPIHGRLAVYYDGSPDNSIGHGNRDIALLWLDLPLHPPG